MAKQIQDIQERVQNVYGFVTDTAHKTFLIGLGSVSLAQDEVKDLWKSSGELTNKMVERGEKVSQARREQITELQDKTQTQVTDAAKKAGGTFEKYSDQVLTRVNLNMPSIEDFEALSKKFTALNRKVDKALKEQKQAVADVDMKVTAIDQKLDAVLEEKVVA